ncbi:MAG: hypothetical protein E7052_01035 [Lentisphaerae bacterium]|nr:hypothetical protein [Lentisphaerota bacterium]
MKIRRLICPGIADGVNNHIYSGRVTTAGGIIQSVEAGDFAVEAPGDILLEPGQLLCPAFVDAHGHSDISVMAMPEAVGKQAQGIAFEVSGNCGLSPFPLTEKNRAHLQELYRQYQIPLTWSDHDSYQNELRKRNCALELFSLTGHNTLRAAVAGYEKKHLSASELQDMQLLLDKELSAGSPGLSLGLLYVPGCFATPEELCALLQVVARHNKICTVHLKSEGNELEEALQETLQIARQANLTKLHLSHLKTAGAANHHKLPAILQALQTPYMRVTGDVYCYDASMTQLSVILPAPFDDMDDIKLMQILQQPEVFEQARQGLQAQRSMEYWQQVRLISAAAPFDAYCSMFLSQAAQKHNTTPAELCLQIIRQDAAGARAAFHTLSKKNMELLAAHAAVVPGSDESARNTSYDFGISHPRGFGNHPTYFALRRSQNCNIAGIVREMSALPAEIFDLPQIGRIQSGCRAVFTVLNTGEYCARSTFAAPHTPAVGAKVITL